MLVDTDILIDCLRGKIEAEKLLNAMAPFEISVVTFMELLQGVRDKAEMRVLRASMNHWQARIVYADEPICVRALMLMESLQLSHAIGLQDALIAATALARGGELLTGNEKHYRAVEGLEIIRYGRRRGRSA